MALDEYGESERQNLRWVRDAISKGYGWEKIEVLLRDNQTPQNTIDDIKKLYDEETEEREKMKLSFMQRRSLKRMVKKSQKKLKTAIDAINVVSKEIRPYTIKERKNLDVLKEEMIVAIIGNEDKGIQGLLDIFDSTDDKGNRVEIDRKMLEEMSIDEVTEIFEDLIEELKKNV